MEISTQTFNEGLELDLNEVVAEVTGLIERNAVMVLATCAQERVTARSMSVVHNGLAIYFQTGTTLLKFDQMIANPNVALCAGNLQIEGRAREIGHPLAPENAWFAGAYSQRHPGSFKTYSGLAENRVFEVTPQRVVLWKYDASGKPFRDFLDLESKRAWREMYPIEG
jgi:hypothetical protein